MAVIDFIPELLTVGTVASSFAGAYFERVRKKIQREEPAQMEQAASEAVAEASLESPVSISLESDQDEKVPVSRRELEKLLGSAVGTAVTAMKDELAVERKKDRRAGFQANLAFLVAGIMATVAITLYVHPLK